MELNSQNEVIVCFRFTESAPYLGVLRTPSIQKSPIPSGAGKIDENKFERCEIV